MDEAESSYNVIVAHRGIRLRNIERGRTMVKRVAGLLLFSLFAFSAVSGAVAQAPPDPAVVAACTGDAQRLCRGIQPGEGRIAQCLRARVAELSPGCIQAVQASRQAAHPPPR
jgi:hypothetical protein